ncbi:cilia- and flagella-associated protein 157 isoform X2 [Trachinotus anak]|uniref:cilia- and flagella-associated protein 157 isoform X2 n=1 Tax=Trachinotus anak TaxID=443729 RepID=UPI0039F1E861
MLNANLFRWITGCQLRCGELEKQKEHLASQYSALEKDKKDVTEHLKRAVAAKEKKVEEMLEQMESQKQAAEQDREALKLQHRKEMKELQEQAEKLNSDSMIQATKIEEHKEQLMQLMQQLSEKQSQEKQLVTQREKQEAAFNNLRMETMLEKEKMIEETQKEVDDCIKKTVSSVLMVERVQHSRRLKQFQFLLSEMAPLQRERDILQDRERDLCVRRDDLKKDLKNLTKDSFVHKKELKQVRRRCQQLLEEQQDLSITHILAQMEPFREQMASLSEEYYQKTAEAVQLGTELQKERSRSRQLEGVKQEAAIILRHILTDLAKPSETQWKMHRLLEILESIAPQGAAPFLGPKPAKRLLIPVDPSAAAPQQIDSEAGASTSTDH